MLFGDEAAAVGVCEVGECLRAEWVACASTVPSRQLVEAVKLDRLDAGPSSQKRPSASTAQLLSKSPILIQSGSSSANLLKELMKSSLQQTLEYNLWL